MVNLDHHVITIVQYIPTFHLRTGIIDNEYTPLLGSSIKSHNKHAFPGICPRSSPPITFSQAHQAFRLNNAGNMVSMLYTLHVVG
jgi:hypothetical protein